MIGVGTAGTPGNDAAPQDAGAQPDTGTHLPDAQVDAQAPPVLSEDGVQCSTDDQCKSHHCDGVCCSAGDCCASVADCRISSGIPLACNDPATCQGSGGVIKCKQFRCVAEGGDPNDSACDDTVVANECGPFLPVYCNGEQAQTAPICPTSCKSDADCDADAHCDGVCVPDVPTGGSCARDADCESDHCSNQVCCAAGDCCQTADSCPPSYSGPAICDNPSACSGSRMAAMCVQSQCASARIDDDSGCTSDVLANACGHFFDIYCTGAVDQRSQVCLVRCNHDSQCDSDAYCQVPPSSSHGTCEPRQPDATPCDRNAMCAGNSCGDNGLCCSDTQGECCTTVADCTSSRYMRSECVNQEQCLGAIYSPECSGGRCRAKMATSSMLGCEHLTHECGENRQPAMCPNPCKPACDTDADCTMDTVCSQGECVSPAAGQGGAGGQAGMSGASSGGPRASSMGPRSGG